jgi:Aspartyl/Asparaginyl beta-hydroxylase
VSSQTAADPVASSLIAFLEAEGAGETRHAAGRSLLDHLLETYAILRRWGQPEWLAHAALLHSVYGTDRYKQQLVPLSRRREISQLAGDRAERMAYLFSAVPRGPLLSGTYRWASPPPLSDEVATPSRDELDALVLLHMANLAEQARAEDGAPGPWLARVRELAELLIDSEAVALPLFLAKLATFSKEDEALVRRAYLAGIGSEQRLDRLALAASVCPVIPEPCVWLAYLAACRGDSASARSWAACARDRLFELGVSWDKRLSFEEWRRLAEAIPRAEAGEAAPMARHPAELFETVVEGGGARVSLNSPGPDAGRKRFQRYVEGLAEGDGSPLGATYPDLLSEPWLNPRDFPLAAYLESHYAAIRTEIMSLSPSSFQPEAERIQRSGDWDVAFFYERGRRRHAVCEACPVTTRGLEAYGAISTLAGLAYASRMRPGTHIQPHRGPTNVRVRCHLGIVVPEGDCAIRVGAETRRWEEGRCLVFDDHFEHEAWNHTAEDRIVLIVDVWHPGLSSTEVSLLEGLQRYASAHARKLNRYWAANAAAAKEA